jgi:hypothetical protein
MIAGGFVAIATMRKGTAADTTREALATRAEDVADRLARELIVAGMRGEDENGNGVLDAGEDVDRNGRLDADWNVADGATVSDATFNVRNTLWSWSGPIRWHVGPDGVLMRDENGRTTQMARGVQAFTVARSGDEVTIRVVLQGTDATGAAQSDAAERRVYVRN